MINTEGMHFFRSIQSEFAQLDLAFHRCETHNLYMISLSYPTPRVGMYDVMTGLDKSGKVYGLHRPLGYRGYISVWVFSSGTQGLTLWGL